MSTHNAVIDWTLSQATDADFLAGHYSRAHTIGFDGGVTLPGSSSPSVVRPPWSEVAAADPEEMLVASVSSCHMLWFLDLAKQAGFAVRRYRDTPEGRMGKMPGGAIGITRIVLRPSVRFGGTGPSAAELDALHHKAHAACFIANSLNSEILVLPALEGP
jgi:organic hydroperoxide reductase OsmC/OhrA